MDFGKSKPSLVDPHLMKKLNIKSRQNFKYFSWLNMSKDIRDYLLIGIFILLLGYFLYSRYNMIKNDRITKQVVINETPEIINLPNNGINHQNNPYYQPPPPPENYNRHQYHQQVNQRQQMELQEQKEEQFRRINHPIDISEPKPININPTEQFQQENIHPTFVHPYDYSLKGKSFGNQNPTLVGHNFAPL